MSESTGDRDYRCPLCESTHVARRVDIDPIIRSVYERSRATTCADCGVSFMFPLPGSGDIGSVYEEAYFHAYTEQGIAMPAEAELPPERYLRRLVAVQQRSGAGSLLEIGPGSGAFLNYARNAGWRVTGLEASQYASQKAAARYGLDIRCGTLESVDLDSEQFDMVHMSHVLEHMTNPAASLEIVFRKLKSGGSLVVEVPHEFDNLQFRILMAAGLLRPYDVQCSHIFFFTPGTLKGLLARTGFQRTDIATVRDLEGGSIVRRFARRVAATIERPLGMAPLIEAIAVK